MENGRKTTISRHFRGLVPVPNSVVPVPSVFWSIGTGTDFGPMLVFWP